MGRAPAIAVALAALSLIACSAEQTATDTAKSAVRQQLKDPPSARFRDIYVVQAARAADGFQQLSVCGIVDGKNSFGAYTGGSRFVARFLNGRGSPDLISATVEGDDRRAAGPTAETIFEKIYWNPWCVDAAHPATATADPETVF